MNLGERCLCKLQENNFQLIQLSTIASRHW